MPSSRRKAIPSAVGRWRAPTSWWWRPGSRAQGCIGPGRMQTPCWCCARWSAVTGGKRSGLKSAKGCGERPGSAGWDDGSGQEGRRVWKQRRIPGRRLGGDCQAPSSVPGNMPGQSMARPQTLAQALIGYPQQTTLGAAWPSGENASLQTIPIRPTRKPDAHPPRPAQLTGSP